MGSKNLAQKTKEIELMVPLELYEDCLELRTCLNHLEALLETDFPGANETTSLSHLNFQEALYSYLDRLSEAIAIEKIKKSNKIPALRTPYAELIPNFLRYLREFGEVSFSSATTFEGLERFGVFLSRNSDEPKLLGLIDIKSNPFQVEYSGYVPTNLPDSEFFKLPVYHLSSPNLGEGNFVHLRLFCEKKDEKINRLDGYQDRGIDFP